MLGLKAREWVALAGIGLIVIAFYWKIFLGFFQQDEWLAFGRHILTGGNARETLENAVIPYSVHYTPLTFLSINFLFSLFRLNYLGYAAVSLLLHLVATILVFYLARLVFKKDLPAFLTALLFGVGAAGFQATAWVVADIATHGATIFGLLSLILLFRFLKKKEEKFFTGSLLSLIISLLFKEITVGLFLFIPLALYILGKNQLSKNQKYLRITAIVAGIYILARIVMLFLPAAVPSATVVQSQTPAKIVYNLVTVPMKAISQTVIPAGQLRQVAEFITRFLPERITGIQGTPAYEAFVVKRTLEVVSLGLFFLISILAFFIWQKDKDRLLRKVLAGSFLFILLNSFVFAFAPERKGVIFLIDSRNLYFVSVGTALLLVSAALVLAKHKLGRVFLLLLPLFFLNIFWLEKEIGVLVERGTQRREILSEVKSAYPKLPDKVVFYTESDESSYGLPPEERVLPFQSGFGQTLLVWYYPTEIWPAGLFENRFLWEITEEGYKQSLTSYKQSLPSGEGKESGERGFGYFRDFDSLVKNVSENKIDTTSILAFSYNSKDKKITDITGQTRGAILGLNASKFEVDLSNVSVNFSHNGPHGFLALDGKRNTYWSSETPYATKPQYFEMDFKREIKIAQIRLDSFDNKDQNEVGYAVSLSENGKDWEEIFRTIRRTSRQDGIIDIYLPKSKTRFLRVDQIGEHEYAPWVIHELQVYEATD